MSGLIHVSLPLNARPIPPPGGIELWLTDLSALPLDAGPGGSTRKERMLRRRIQQQFLLRLLLGSYLDCPGKSIRLVRNEHGKPALSGVQAASGLNFNLSHSGDWLAVVVGYDVALGVDIEVDRRLERASDLAGRFFPAEEAHWLQGQDEPFLSRQFLNQWTAREALAKANGRGLAGVLGRIELGWQPAAIRALPRAWPAPHQWTLLKPTLPAGLISHVAAARPDISLQALVLDSV